MEYTLQHQDKGSKARAGVLKTEHGDIQTPVFMPVGTAGTVKGVHQHELSDDIRADIILGNTYHLYLRPGLEVLEKGGGLHKFNSWNKPLLTDSGGYQVYSLSGNRKINEKGVKFQSHIDGSYHMFTPERSIEIQRSIGADIIMAFDECTPYPCPYDYAKDSMEMTHRWLKRCFTAFDESEPMYGYEQALFPIVQGSVYPELRKISAHEIASHEAVGYAIGGLSVGEPDDDLYAMTDLVADILPKEKPRYLMGVGTPINLLECVALGIDMFDCVMPTRNARHGMIYTSEGTINIRNKKWFDDFSVLDPNGTSYVDHTYTKAYLRHLIISNEYLGLMIASIHNLSFYLELMRSARAHIIEGDFYEWKEMMVKKMDNRL